tara:strand:+ start:45 stop:680 length:636 start_codon:yes stop_codon:yes gene_type:complete
MVPSRKYELSNQNNETRLVKPPVNKTPKIEPVIESFKNKKTPSDVKSTKKLNFNDVKSELTNRNYEAYIPVKMPEINTTTKHITPLDRYVSYEKNEINRITKNYGIQPKIEVVPFHWKLQQKPLIACKNFANAEEDGFPIDPITLEPIKLFKNSSHAIQPNRIHNNYNDKYCYASDTIKQIYNQILKPTEYGYMNFQSPTNRETWYTNILP